MAVLIDNAIREIELSKISEKLLNQRMRNRIIDVLSVYSSDEGWELLGPGEVINQWEDIVTEETIKNYLEPVFTVEEQEGLIKFHEKWLQYCQETPKFMPSFKKIKEIYEWQSLQHAARELYALFMIRGTLDEEAEIN